MDKTSCSTRDWQDVVSDFVQLSILFRRLHVFCRKCCFAMPTAQYKKQSRHCIFEKISHKSKCSVLPMLVNNSFDTSPNGIEFFSLFPNRLCNKSRFGCFLDCWISLFTIPLRFNFLECWVWYTLYFVINVTTKSFLGLRASFALMVGGSSRFGKRMILTSMVQIRR